METADLAQQLAQPFPASWPVQRALDTYLEENGFTTAEYDKSVIHVTFWWFTFPFPNPPSRQIAVRLHDLHHVVTGYGTDPAGEAEVSAWEFRRGVRVFGHFVRCIVTVGFFAGFFHSPRRTLAAWRAAFHPDKVPLQPASLDVYEKLLALSVGELRARYGVPPEGIAGARELHYAAPSRKKSSG